MGPKSDDWCPFKEREICRHMYTEERRPSKDGGSNWSDVAKSQGMVVIAGNPQKLEEAKKDSPLEPSEGTWPASILISDFWPPEL